MRAQNTHHLSEEFRCADEKLYLTIQAWPELRLRRVSPFPLNHEATQTLNHRYASPFIRPKGF